MAYFDNASPEYIERIIGLQAAVWKHSAAWQKLLDYRAYYAGDQPSMLSERQEEFLGTILTGTIHPVVFNLCSVVIDVLRERLRVEGLQGTDDGGEALAEQCWQWWQAANMDALQSTVYRRALRDSKAYLIVDWDAELGQPTWKANRLYDGDTGVTFHRAGESDKPLMAIKYWRVDDVLDDDYAQLRRTIYTPDMIRRYEMAHGQWAPLDERKGKPVEFWTETFAAGGKPLGLPVIEFVNPGEQSELVNIIGLQNGLNKTLLDLLAAADSTGFQMLAISYKGPLDAAPVDDPEQMTDDLKIAPGRAIELGDDARVTTLPAGDLSQLIGTIRTLVGFIGATTRTPQYYLTPFGGADVPSGEALKQLETALVSRAKERFTVFGGAWVEALRVGARLWAAMGGRNVDTAAALEVSWADPNIKNELYMAQVATAEQGLGVPQEVLWAKRLDYSPEEIADMRAMQQAADAEKIVNVIGALNNRNASNGTEQPGGNGRGGAAVTATGGNGASGAEQPAAG